LTHAYGSGTIRYRDKLAFAKEDGHEPWAKGKAKSQQKAVPTTDTVSTQLCPHTTAVQLQPHPKHKGRLLLTLLAHAQQHMCIAAPLHATNTVYSSNQAALHAFLVADPVQKDSSQQGRRKAEEEVCTHRYLHSLTQPKDISLYSSQPSPTAGCCRPALAVTALPTTHMHARSVHTPVQQHPYNGTAPGVCPRNCANSTPGASPHSSPPEVVHGVLQGP
jgi:hypothetical protein